MTHFSVTCPACQHANDDPFEVMARGSVDWTTCVGCRRPFSYLILLCEHCVEESAFTGTDAALQDVAFVTCKHCSRPLSQNDEAEAVSSRDMW